MIKVIEMELNTEEKKKKKSKSRMYIIDNELPLRIKNAMKRYLNKENLNDLI